MAVAKMDKEKEPRENAIVRTFREVRSEMKKVVWPSREETQRLTLVVIGISLSIGLLLGGFDFLFAELARLIRTI